MLSVFWCLTRECHGTDYIYFVYKRSCSVHPVRDYMYTDDTRDHILYREDHRRSVRCVKSIPKRFVYLICEEQVDTSPKEIRTMLIDRGSFTGPIPPLYLGGNSLGLLTHSRLLGVIIDNKWGCSIHIKELKKNFVKRLNLIKKSRLLPKQDLLNLYFGSSVSKAYFPKKRTIIIVKIIIGEAIKRISESCCFRNTSVHCKV